MSTAFAMLHDTNPSQEIKRKVGDISGLEIFHNLVLVGTYIRPERTKSGLYMPDQSRDEDKWQGKVGLVLALGPLAFVDDERVSFAGVTVKEGDWITYRASDGWQLTINSWHCRMLEDSHIRGRLSSPDLVW